MKALPAPIAGACIFITLGISGLLLGRWRQPKGAKKRSINAFIEQFEIEPPPTPAPPMAPPPLSGLSFAVKDIFDIEGKVTGFGTPDWAATHGPAAETALVVKELVQNGAKCVGKTHMDQLAFSITGENKAYGTPLNPAAPDCVPGGSSSGSAAAVAAGLADFALGTDTCGSIRIPAAYCGILGFRPSHGLVPVTGVVPMSPSLDAVGCLARDSGVLRAVGHVMLQLPSAELKRPRKILLAEDLFALSSAPKEPVIRALTLAANNLLGRGRVEKMNLGEYLARSIPLLREFETPEKGGRLSGPAALAALREAMRALQGFEFKAFHGEWVEKTKPDLSSDIQKRVQAALKARHDLADKALRTREQARAALADLLQDDILLCLPTAPGLPPKLGTLERALEDFRTRAMSLVAISGMAGLPQVSMPAGAVEGGGPLAVSLCARHGADVLLLDTVQELAPRLEAAAAEVSTSGQAPPEERPQLSPAEEAKEKGNAALKAKKYKKAEKHYTEAIKLDGSNTYYYSNRAWVHIQLGNYPAAEADCTKALALNKKNVKALLRRGTAYEFMAAYDKAVEDFQLVLVLEPNNATARQHIEQLRMLYSAPEG